VYGELYTCCAIAEEYVNDKTKRGKDINESRHFQQQREKDQFFKKILGNLLVGFHSQQEEVCNENATCV